MLLSMLLAALLGSPTIEPVAAAIGSPSRTTAEISLAEALRALPAGSASTNGNVLSDDGGSGGDTPILPGGIDGLPAPFSTAESFPVRLSAEPAQRRTDANQARAPPAA